MLVFLLLITGCCSLKCWRCVGPDCKDINGPSAALIDCPSGSQCQVSQLEFYDIRLNETRIMIPVRGCSYDTGCLSSVDVSTCERVPNEFAGMGCQRTKCCVEDGCNSASLASSSPLACLIAALLISALSK